MTQFTPVHLTVNDKDIPYLEVNVPSQEVACYLEQMRQCLIEKDYQAYLLNQQQRDRHQYHITLINPLEYDDPCKQTLYQTLEGTIVSYHLIGLGRVTQDEEDVFFVVAESSDMTQLRDQVGLPKRDFHVTLGFKNNDIHDVVKDKTTLIDFIEES